MTDESRMRYVQLDDPIGVTHLNMRDKSFQTRTAMLFSVQPNWHGKTSEDAVFWNEVAVRGQAVFW